MKTTVREDRLLVISDIHMGNGLHRTRRPFMDFLQFALENEYSICINGDGIDIAQLSLSQLNDDLTPSLGLLMRFRGSGRRIYYTVGNHDIVLEHFLTDMGGMMVAPFLNVTSGARRIRVEHGHMYDGMFLKFPRIYFLFMLIGRLGIAISPRAYEGLHRFNAGFIRFVEWVFSGFGRFGKGAEAGLDAHDRIPGERECFHEGAEDVGMRGFDAVVFGHTHLPGSLQLADGLAYYNTGAWFSNPFCVAIDGGRTWFGPVAQLVERGDPFPRTKDLERRPEKAVPALAEAASLPREDEPALEAAEALYLSLHPEAPAAPPHRALR